MELYHAVLYLAVIHVGWGGGGPAGRYGRIRQVNPEVVFFRPPIHSLLSFSFVISLLFFLITRLRYRHIES